MPEKNVPTSKSVTDLLCQKEGDRRRKITT